MKNKFNIVIVMVLVVVISAMIFFLSKQASTNTPIEQTDTKISETITFNKLGGGTIKLSDYVNEKPVILNFWASWCPYCQKNMPILNQLYEKYKHEIEVIGVNMEETEQTAQNFIKNYSINFPIVLDSNGKITDEFGVLYTNTHVLIGLDGSVVKVIPGDIQESDFQSLL